MTIVNTNSPHPPTSSTQGTSTAQNTAVSDESDRTVASDSVTEKDLLKVAEDGSENTSRSRGLLHVPSRSSSQKVQPSPTSTGLSGVTASDPRESIGGQSKESKGSVLGRRRNGSASTSKMSITPPGPSSDPAANAPASAKPTSVTKKKSLFSRLCCGAPDHADGADAALPAAKIAKVSQRPTTSSKPENSDTQTAPATQPLLEKDTLRQADLAHGEKATSTKQETETTFTGANGELSRPGDSHNQSPPQDLNANRTRGNQSNPSVLVEAPTPDTTVPPTAIHNAGGDTKMENADSLPPAKDDAQSTTNRVEEPATAALPPPPPVPPGPTEEERAIETADGKQQWLLPPIAPRFKGKKCLVLDLDETLVHSSFKVSHFSLICCYLQDRCLLVFRYCTKQTLLFLSK